MIVKNVLLCLTIPVFAAGTFMISLLDISHPVKKEKKGFAVVELFTSEGCSSCPAADAALTRIAQNYKSDVYVLGFHVDYWNRLGWKDAFSDAAYSERQRLYSNTKTGDGVYTPQAIINGNEHLVGSSESKIRKFIDASLAGENSNDIHLTVNQNGSAINIDYDFDNKNDVLNIALIQRHAETNVRSGENGGHTLKHINIVRDFKSVTAAKGTITLNIPASLDKKDCALISYSQDKKTWLITSATELSLE